MRVTNEFLQDTVLLTDHVLLEELNHRFLNGLQLLVSLSNGLASGRDARPQVVAVRHFQARIANLAEVHRLLSDGYRATVEGGLEIRARRLLSGLTAAFGRTPTKIHLTCGPVCVPAEPIQLLLLLLTELIINALKHGAAGRPIKVALGDRGPGGMIMAVSNECGDDMSLPPPRVAKLLAHKLGATLHTEITDGEFCARLTAPAGVAQAIQGERCSNAAGSAQPFLPAMVAPSATAGYRKNNDFRQMK